MATQRLLPRMPDPHDGPKQDHTTMSSQSRLAPRSTLWGWASHLLRGDALPRPVAIDDGLRDERPRPRATPRAGVPDLVREFLDDDRYAFLLLKEAEGDIEPAHAALGWARLAEQMALVPAGLVSVVQADGLAEPTEVAGFYLDRCAVTNEQYARFVRAGGYDQLEIWPAEVLASLMRFVDRTGRPGPRDWQDGEFPRGKADHPVAGISWYEAVAYARWIGKRLPTSAEWQKAAGWPEHHKAAACRRYPWGELFAEGKANLWSAGLGGTVPVGEFRAGSTPNGIHQLAGNVWEWLDDSLETIPGCLPDESFCCDRPMRRIVGGAFDTYLAGEATNSFITGQPVLDRRPNLGFRCAVSVDRLRPAS